MIVFGGLLVVAGLVTFVAGVGEGPGSWWLLPPGLFAAGVGVLVAGTIAALRRRLAPVRAARRASAAGGEVGGGPLRRVRAVPTMIAKSWRGEYPELSRFQTLVWLVALVYVISPVDIVPEFLPLIGITDDIGVGAWLLSTLYAEAGTYVGQQRSASREVDAGSGS